MDIIPKKKIVVSDISMDKGTLEKGGESRELVHIFDKRLKKDKDLNIV